MNTFELDKVGVLAGGKWKKIIGKPWKWVDNQITFCIFIIFFIYFQWPSGPTINVKDTILVFSPIGSRHGICFIFLNEISGFRQLKIWSDLSNTLAFFSMNRATAISKKKK